MTKQFPKRLNIPNEDTRTYATPEALDRALLKYGFANLKHMVVRDLTGRYTAIFVDREANPVIFRGFPWVGSV